MKGSDTTGLGIRLTLVALATLGCLLAGGCESLRPFNNQLAAGYEAARTVREGTLSMLRAREITPGQAQAVQDKTDRLRGSLDLAARVHEADPGEASGVLSRALSAIDQVSRCTAVERPDLAACVDRVEVPR